MTINALLVHGSHFYIDFIFTFREAYAHTPIWFAIFPVQKKSFSSSSKMVHTPFCRDNIVYYKPYALRQCPRISVTNTVSPIKILHSIVHNKNSLLSQYLKIGKLVDTPLWHEALDM